MKLIKMVYDKLGKWKQDREHSSRASETVNRINSIFDTAINHLLDRDIIDARTYVSTAEYVYRRALRELEFKGAPNQIREMLTSRYFDRLNKIRGDLYSC